MAKVIVDLDEILESWAIRKFRSKASWRQKRLQKQGFIGITIDWKRVNITQKDPDYKPPPPKPDNIVGIPSVLFSTTYANKTKERQVYHFNAVRTSKSSCVTSVDEAVTKGQEFNLQITTPGEIMEANAGFKREITITKSSSQATEEELSWGADSEIQVDGGKSATAKMVISEAEYNGTFVVETILKGFVRFIFTNKKDHNSLVKNIECDIYDVLKESVMVKQVISLNDQTRSVVCTTTGQCSFKYGLRQDVEVTEEDI